MTQASARSPSGLISLPVSVMPSKNNDRLKNKLTAVNIPLDQRKLPWLTVTKEQIENAIFPKNMNRPEGLNKSEIIQLLIQVCCDRRTLFDADGKIKSTIELRKMLAYWQSFAYRASVDGPLWSTWAAPESWENTTGTIASGRSGDGLKMEGEGTRTPGEPKVNPQHTPTHRKVDLKSRCIPGCAGYNESRLDHHVT